MNVLILGSGGREHAIAHAVLKSSRLNKLFFAPGNGGTCALGETLDVDLSAPFIELIDACKKHNIDLVVVGPEAYLIDGVVDALEVHGIKAFGPSKDAARLEGSKAFAKEIMNKAGVKTAAHGVFTNKESASDFLKKQTAPFVLKADGIAAGKGVMLLDSLEEALEALDDYFVKKAFGSSGETLVIESFLKGYETSILAFCDGHQVRMLKPSQDHKRIFDGDRGPNTGGMGVYTPVKDFKPEHLKKVEQDVLLPTLREMKNRGVKYKGVLYAGLMIDGDDIQVVEYNCRFGDPEAQCVLPLLESDILDIMEACVEEKLEQVDFELHDSASVTVVMASGGYPSAYKKDLPIHGLENVQAQVCHAGTRLEAGELLSAGGRVLAVSAQGDSLKTTIDEVYREVEKIQFQDCYYRKDIGKKGL